MNRLFSTPAVEPLVGPARELARDLEMAVLHGVPGKGELVTQLMILKSNLQAMSAQETQVA